MNVTKPKSKSIDLKETFLTFPMYIISNPFKGFGDLKYYHRSKTIFPVVIMFLLCVVDIARYLYEGFVIKEFHDATGSSYINVPYFIVINLGPVFLFVIANWSITAITNGIGKMKEILQVYAHACYPRLILCVIGLIVSNMVTKEEAVFATFFYNFGSIAFGFYLFIGLIIIHEYSFTKAIAMIILTIVAMLIIVFILALFMSLANEVYVFFYTVITELSLKL